MVVRRPVKGVVVVGEGLIGRRLQRVMSTQEVLVEVMMGEDVAVVLEERHV